MAWYSGTLLPLDGKENTFLRLTLPGGETIAKLIVIQAHKAQLITGLLLTTF